MFGKENPIPLARRLMIDAHTSSQEVKSGRYEHADRNARMYRGYIPGLDLIIKELIDKHNLVRMLDVGCGTGRAAQELSNNYHPNVSVRGLTLVYHPPLAMHAFLPREKIIVSSVSDSGIQAGSIDVATAIGSLDTSGTIHEEGAAVLDLIREGGVFIFAPTTGMSSYKNRDLDYLIQDARTKGFHYNRAVSDYASISHYFLKGSS